MELERDVEEYLVREVNIAGGTCYKFVSPGRRGVPDRLVVCRGRIFFVELKKKSGRLSALQKVEARAIQSQNVEVFTVYSKAQVDEVLKRKGLSFHAS